MRNISFSLYTTALLFIALICNNSFADVAGSSDHPLISRFEGAEIKEFKFFNYYEMSLPAQKFSRIPPSEEHIKKVAGKITLISYLMPEGTSILEVIKNYEMALMQQDYNIVFECQGGYRADSSCGSSFSTYIYQHMLPRGFGRESHRDENRYLLAESTATPNKNYIAVYTVNHGNNVYAEVIVAEEQAIATGKVVVKDAPALKSALDKSGKVVVDGVYFDTAKATIKSESSAALEQMAKLLQANTGLNVYIVGHTDNQGIFAANMTLSKQRADAVMSYLIDHFQIDAARLSAHGVASLAPEASNNNEHGRSRNRRVELVVQ